MGAPTKEGLDYFPFYVDLLDNDDLDDLRIEYGCIANDIYIALLTLLYRKKGYYIPYSTEQERADCHRYIYKRVRGGKYPTKLETIPRVIEGLAAKGLIERDLYPKIITSERAQRVYYSATVERSPDSFNIIPKYWMLDENTMRKLSKKHPYYLSIQSKSKSDEKSNKSDEEYSKSDEKTLKKSKVNNTPYIPLKGGGERDFKGEFFKAYPKLKPVRTDDSFVDYSALLKAFEKSECLRTRYSMRWVLENYDAVIRGDFADAESAEGARAARESWYAERRAAAEERAHKALQQALKDEAYAAADGWVRQLAPRIAFEKDEKLAEAMQAQLDDTERAKAERLKELGLDIQVHYRCTKCSDTGFLPNGRPCDCYNKED